MTPRQLDAAAFWHSRVCLGCGLIVDDEDAEACPFCESEEVVPAELVKKCVDVVDRDEGESE